ncbi:TPA: hypothetical protein I7245_08700 [Vibrio vulnificus]|nr:hypothetical protein [Vibrio vulnificus]
MFFNILNLHQDPLSGDGAYDTRYCHDETRFKRPVWLIPPERVLRWGKMVPEKLSVGK